MLSKKRDHTQITKARGHGFLGEKCFFRCSFVLFFFPQNQGRRASTEREKIENPDIKSCENKKVRKKKIHRLVFKKFLFAIPTLIIFHSSAEESKQQRRRKQR